MMREGVTNTWDGTGITQTIETGDFRPTGNMFDQTLLRHFKFVMTDISESTNLTITHYKDSATSGTELTLVDLSGGTNRIFSDTQIQNLAGDLHRLKFSATTSTTAKGLRPIEWGALFEIAPFSPDLTDF